MGEMILTLVGSILAIAIAVVAIVFLVVPLFKGIAWLVVHLFKFITGIIGDLLRFIGAIITALVFVPLILVNVIIGRWSAAAHFGRGLQSELRAGGFAMYRVVVSHPARLFLLTPLVEGIEQRVPDAMAKAPGADKPSKRTGQFEGYEIVGSLQGGGSGGRLYVAKPDAKKQAIYARAGQRDVTQVVIKSFSLADGSTLPQMVRESRALEAARNLGLILDHELTDERFFYVMRYIPGEDLTTITKRLHAEAGTEGLTGSTLSAALGYAADLLTELDVYHRGGLWHKDVKPDNIIISGDRAHVVDFGLVTPLRSAMTLTTHGTEYFRDPEMVRMALRGAKVNEVDGVKFDLYGAGAVLYSVIENSFPAHGALSQINKKCPDTLRWIVRRMMADMHHRYPSARAVLADLRVVMAAADPFALKPIDLPSVSGQNAGAPFEEPRVQPFEMPRVERAAHAAPPAGSAADADRSGFVFDATVGAGSKVREFHVGPAPHSAPGPGGGRTRPKLVVTDWLTGRYAAEGGESFPHPNPASADRYGRAAEQVARQVATGFGAFARSNFAKDARQKAEEFARSAEPHARRAAGTAAEQLARAQERIRRAQDRAAQRMGRSPSRGYAAAREFNTRPNPGVVASVFLFLAACVGGSFLIISSALKNNRGDEQSVAATESPIETIAIDIDNGRGQTEFSVSAPSLLPAFPTPPAKPLGTIEIGAFKMEIPDPSAPRASAPATVTVSSDGNGESPAAPPSIDPIEDPQGVILVVDTQPVDFNPDTRRKLVWTIEALNHDDFRILGVGDSENDIRLVAAAKGIIGLGGPNDKDTREALRAWLSDNSKSESVDAILWASQEDDRLRFITRRGFDTSLIEKALRDAAE